MLLFLFFGTHLIVNNKAEAVDLRSPAFNEGEYIPKEYTGFGADHSPELEWADIPEGVRSFAIIMDDSDASVGVWVHWVIYNIPGESTVLSKNVNKNLIFINNAMQGINSFNLIGYDGPFPPPGSLHRYIFKLYALDVVLDLKPGATKKQLEKSIDGHVLDKAGLTGLYKR